ncbi:MAG: hypothetical protein A2W19_09240 [Spirochaetes bacterium RBG_16_49_21]|nr:MAG: hypothetical protein A2W19_09240 [Spirochaetes bacterium RBG_16_49_21]
MIDIKNLSLTISGRVILDDVAVSLDDGEIIGVIGQTGSGKTMLLKTIAGLISDHEGLVAINGRRTDAKQRRKGTDIFYYGGTMPHNPDERLYDFILLSRIPFKKFMRPFSDDDRRIADEYADLLGLDSLKDERLGILPSGIFKRAMLAHALIKQPYALLLDNPTNDLDIASLRLLKKALSRHVMNGDRIALVCSNDLNFISQTADRILVMDGGRLVRIGDAGMLTADMIKRYFGIDALISRNVYTGKPEVHFFPDA